ncbi:MAG: DNA-processing protein DprA [Patescibacteria group bacterium]|nr:DNA-processing protein DprA [Patescibacteria group bacterium]MDE1946032.1 DNA-processing protein DprA [Patescibacteria group bacterium]
MYRDFETFDLRPNEFPEKLREINDPPKILHVKGTLPHPDTKILCVVGSRKHTAYGKEACEKLIAGLAGYDICIVSGLALGIDAVAHRAALAANLKTIAVPGSGLDEKVLYPVTNKRLAEEILLAGGAIMSEFDADTIAAPWTFPQRNRIMAGLADATLVIEAELKSGTLITSKFATEYNRDVLAVPGSIFSKNSDGPHMLIRLGATPVRTSEDILEALGFKVEQKIENLKLKYADCSDEEMLVVKLLAEPLQKDELVRQMKMPISKASVILSMMELKGLVEERMGEIYLS